MRDSPKPTSFHQLTAQHQAFLISGYVFSRSFSQVQINLIIWGLNSAIAIEDEHLGVADSAIA